MNTLTKIIWGLSFLSGFFLFSCTEDEFGANPYDPSTPITVSQLPKVTFFEPIEGKSGDTILVKGVNFETTTNVAFGGKQATSFNIIDDSTLTAVVSPYGGTGAVAVTNHKGTRSMPGFRFIKEVAPDSDINIALEGTASGSDPIAGNIVNVNDGDAGSFWQAKDKENLWVEIDLGKVKSLNTIILTWDPNAAGTDFDLMISKNGKDYTSILTVKAWDAVGDGGVNKILFEEVDARYVKLANMTNTATPWNATLYEFEIYNKDYENLAKEKEVSASSEFYPVTNIVMGNRDFFWAANEVGDQWVLVDLGKEYEFNNVDLYWGIGNYAKQTTISISNDGDKFEDIYTSPEWAPTLSAGYELQRLLFPTAKARYVKASFVEGTPWTLWCNELEIYKR